MILKVRNAAEFVSPGHPDKVADQIADAFLDYFLSHDPNSRVAIEVLLSHSQIVLAGEVTSKAPTPPYEKIVKTVLEKLGYTGPIWGPLAESHQLLVEISPQSPDISSCISKKQISSGDQGIVIGYACDETDTYMPLVYELARNITKEIEHFRRNQEQPILGPDGKLEVLMKDTGHVVVVVSWQHVKEKNQSDLFSYLLGPITHVCREFSLELDSLFVNKAGPFVIGGPYADTGLTGRKQLIDTYGSTVRHGGGSFSGKDATKVDRSGAYMARCIAKTIVSAKLARQCEVMLIWMMGEALPVGLNINCFGTETHPIEAIEQALLKTFDLRLESLISLFQLTTPIFSPTAAFGHFGRIEFPWETLAFTQTLKEMMNGFPHKSRSLI
jgi:S-adenosylmethionine synthetase